MEKVSGEVELEKKNEGWEFGKAEKLTLAKQKKNSPQPDLNQRPRDNSFNYSLPLYR